MAVGNCLGETGDVRLEAEETVRPAQVQPEAATHVVEDEHDALAAAGDFDPLEKSGRGQRAVAERRVVERCQDHAGDLAAVGLQETLERFKVVPRKTVDVGVVLLDQPAVARRAPGVAAVVRAVDHENFLAAGVFTRDLERPSGHVGAVLAEDGPRGEVHEGDEAFGQVHHERRGVVEAISPAALGVGGGLDLVVRRGHRQRRGGVGVPEDAAGDHARGTVEQGDGAREGAGHGGVSRTYPITSQISCACFVALP